MNTKSLWFEEIEQEFNSRKSIYSGYDVPDTFTEFIGCSKLEEINVLCWLYTNEEDIKKAYTEWLEEEWKSFNTIDLELLDDEDELYPIYEEIARKEMEK